MRRIVPCPLAPYLSDERTRTVVYDCASRKPLTAVQHLRPGTFGYDLVSGEFLYRRVGVQRGVLRLDNHQHLLARSLEAQRLGLPRLNPNVESNWPRGADLLLPMFDVGTVLYGCLPVADDHLPTDTNSLCRDARGRVEPGLALAYRVRIGRLLPSTPGTDAGLDRMVWSYDLPAMRETAVFLSLSEKRASVWIVAMPWTATWFRGQGSSALPSELGLVAASMEAVGECLISPHLPNAKNRATVWTRLCLFRDGGYERDGTLARA